MKALRKQKHVILSAMDVFVKEPMIGWLNIAQEKAQSNFEISTDFDPEEKVRNAERKLEGVNPVAVILRELCEGVLKKDKGYLAACELAVKGNHQENVRSRMPQEGLTVEQQVECLLDLASDFNVLGRLYYGLEPWV